MDKFEILDLFNQWESALRSGDPKRVVELYAADATLLPTISGKVCHNREEIEGYFKKFLAGGPVGELDEANIRVCGEVAINSGVYRFNFKDGSEVLARFTFVYKQEGDNWMIVEHHSSLMPDG